MIQALFLVVSLAWGPYTHQYFGAHLESPASTSDSFIAGCSAPDAFKGTEPSMHSLEFAAALYEQATESNGTADEVVFALGYGCHLCQDMVGHHSRGFLNPAEDHPLELAIDAYVYKEDPSSRAKPPRSRRIPTQQRLLSHAPFQQISDIMTSLVVAASVSAGGNITHPINQSQGVNAVKSFKILTTEEEAALLIDFGYQKAAVADSFCPVNGFIKVQSNFALAQNWSAQACVAWQTTMKNGTTTNTAVRQITQLVDALFTAHNGTSCVD